jgi:hypothetical protein
LRQTAFSKSAIFKNVVTSTFGNSQTHSEKRLGVVFIKLVTITWIFYTHAILKIFTSQKSFCSIYFAFSIVEKKTHIAFL